MEEIKKLIEKEALDIFEKLKQESITYEDLNKKISALRLRKTWGEKDKLCSNINKLIFERISDLLLKEIESLSIKKQ